MMTPVDDAHHGDERSGTAVAAGESTADALLLELLRAHDAACPVCGRALRGITQARCPGCNQRLALTVGTVQLRLGWLLVAVAPGFFSGIAACFLAIPTFGMLIGSGIIFPPFLGAVLFGWMSGIFAITLAVRRKRFLAQSRTRARWFALIIWLTHFAAFLGLIAAIAPHFN